MLFLNTLIDLGRAFRQERLRAQDQVFVPRALRDGADPRDWDALERALERVEVQVHVTLAVHRICVVSAEELGDEDPTKALAP